ncbi:MAG: bifunctional metallophosphatase/5'-nucleotidase [Alistipes sp.]|nr:bifunctional metallophosphatase/5'-nucleotidase [Alistipes sp.]
MRKSLIVAIILIAGLFGIILYHGTLQKREIVIISTNDMHASLDNFPRLATAVQQCRDTVVTVLVDAGDRWTGNAFVDLADGRLPIIDLMNELEYDVATLGNHEFDAGQQTLGGAISHSDFVTLCANMESENDALATLPSSHIHKSDNCLCIGFCGVVTNYDNGHPDGNDAVFEGLRFTDPMHSACHASNKLRRCSLQVLVSHMGDDKDMEYAAGCNDYDIIIGGHTHKEVDTVINNVVIGQTGRRLKNVGVTRIRFQGCKPTDIEYENVPLSNYEPHPYFLQRIAEIQSNPTLRQNIGTLATPLNKVGLANLETALIAKATQVEVAFYHYGGIRLDELPAGGMSLATLFNLEPFSSHLYTMQMTPEQMRGMIIAKYNDRLNAKESHRIDLFCSEPYDIVVDGSGEAVDVRFPTLKRGRKYRVAMGDYIAKKYPGIEAEQVTPLPLKLLDVMEEHLRRNSPVAASNTPKQRIVKR